MSIAESVFSAIFERLVRAGVIVTADWATLRFFENVPFYLVIILLVISGFAFMVLERKEWLQARKLYAIVLVLLVFAYLVVCGYGYYTLPPAHSTPASGTVQAGPAPGAKTPTAPPIDSQHASEKLNAIRDLRHMVDSEAIGLCDEADEFAETQPQSITVDLTVDEVRKNASNIRQKFADFSAEITRFLNSLYPDDADELRSAIATGGIGPDNIVSTLDDYIQSLNSLPQNATASDILRNKQLWENARLLVFRTYAFGTWRTDASKKLNDMHSSLETSLGKTK